jgi:hypothetical protein
MRAKRIFQDLKEDPFVVELDLRGNHPWSIWNFNAVAYFQAFVYKNHKPNINTHAIQTMGVTFKVFS